ncbi:MAG TPA: S41 family peptidase, partial [Thermoanaerobaculia bacterium]|nr:S41 family peptidase [Thermoanaerobaculia bacterium]
MKALLLAVALNWNADLTQLATELPKIHPQPFRVTTREAFLADVEQLRARAPEMQTHEVIVELARITAAIGDGHTRLNLPIDDAYGLFHPHVSTPLPKNPALRFRAIPLRFAILGDALHTLDGRRVTRIGTMTAAEAIAAVRPVAFADNEMQRIDVTASYLPVVEVLHARRVIRSMDEVPVTFADGTTTTFKPVPPPAQTTKTAPEPWSFTWLEREKVVWFDYDEVSDAPDERLAAFAARMFRFIDEHPVERLVIDMRENYGGNHGLNRSLVHGLIRSKKLQAPGSVIALVGRRTYSAASMFAVDLERNTNTIFVGEPTAGSPNGWGDPRKIVLPESGLVVYVSALYWQLSHPRDKRDAIPPHISVAPTLTGDPARDVALDFYGAPATLDGSWKGNITVSYQRADFALVDG